MNGLKKTTNGNPFGLK